MGDGSESYAKEWSEKLNEFDDPNILKEQYPNLKFKEYDDGNWIIGICKDSHSSMFGGTIVLRDSTGTVKSYFGHVCGNHYLGRTIKGSGDTPEDVYALLDKNFKEYKQR